MADNGFRRDASNRLCFEMFRIPALRYPELCRELVDAFGLSPDGDPVAGLDVIFRGYRRGGEAISLGWDIWSGFIVTAKDPESEPLAGEIGAWLLASRWATSRGKQRVPGHGPGEGATS